MMNSILILREELVCMVILLFLLFTSRTYNMGKDSRPFYRLITYGLVHILFDMITVYTVNHMENVPSWINYGAHVVFYISAMLYSGELCCYVIRLITIRKRRRYHLIGVLPVAVYLCLMPMMKMEFVQQGGTWSSSGPAAYIGYGIAFGYFIAGMVMIIIHWKGLSKSVHAALLPMMIVLILTEALQIFIKELLFTGGAITIVTVGFFFSMENPVQVFERKVMTDALTGVRSRHSYNQDIDAADKIFKASPNMDYTFVFCDINNLRAVNGRFGHQEGDRYITLIAGILNDKLISADGIYRMGGDEFMAIYHKVPEARVAEEIAGVKSRCSEETGKMEYVPAVACGYAVSSPEYNSLREVMRTADYMMYRNKAEMKRRTSFLTGAIGTTLNLTGLTDRMFDAMCSSNEKTYPFLTNMETNVTRVSPGWADFFGLKDEFVADFGEVWSAYIHPNDRERYLDDVTQTMNGNQRYHNCQYRARTTSGEYVTCTCHGSLYRGKDGEPDIFAGYMINHGIEEGVDQLTGLPNFIRLDDRVRSAIDHKRKVVILKLGITNLGRINMMYGYSGGNTILKRIVSIITEIVDENGEVFCQNGMNFSLFLPERDRREVQNIYERINKALSGGVMMNGAPVPLEVSGGATEVLPEHAREWSSIRSSLLYALNKSADEEHGCLVFYTPENEESDFDLLAEIHHDALTEQKFFRLRYQLIADTDTGRFTGAEALLRWNNPAWGEVPPGRFIDFLESDPCFYKLGLTIIRDAVRDSGFIRRYRPDFRVNVNITALQLQHQDFVDQVTEILREYDYPPEALVLELTERCKEMDTDLLAAQIAAIRSRHIRVAFDDMGTGYSTIKLLLEIPVDEVKLDQNFVSMLPEKQGYQTFVEALFRGSDTMNYEICFEGIENAATLELLKKYGRSLSQGYLFARPLTFDELKVRLDIAE